MTPTKDLTVREPQTVGHPSTLEVVLRAVAQPGMTPEVARQYLEMAKELEAIDAKKQYTSAFLAVKDVLKDVQIKKDGKITYDKPGKQGGVIKFMQYQDIAKVIQPILAEHDLAASYSYEYTQTPPKIICVMTLRHRSGHSEEFRSVPLPMVDSSGGKNDIQGAGSVGTYGRRYVVCPAFDIVAEGEDDNGTGKGTSDPITEDQWKQIEDILHECNNREPGCRDRFNAWSKKVLQVNSLTEVRQGTQMDMLMVELHKKMKALGI